MKRTDSRGRELSPVDQNALERALAIVHNSSDSDYRGMFDRVMKEDGWFAAADQAVYHCQRALIAPRLWQPTPRDINPSDIEKILQRGPDGLNGEYQAARLLKRMLAAGLSRYEPRPVEALDERAAAARRQRADSEPVPAG
jgi:hypothetical protein